MPAPAAASSATAHTRRRLGIRFARYSVGSVVALVTSEVVFSVTYGAGLLGTTGASVAAFAAGAVPNYIANRRWAWERRGRLAVRREVIGYAAVSLGSLAAAAIATAATGRVAPWVSSSHAVRVALVSASYFATFAVLFVAKFVLLDRLIFGGLRSGAEPEREPGD